MIIPRYINVSYIQTRLYNKVNFLGSTSLINPQFADSDTNVGLTDDQTSVFINQAASYVEYVLSPLYIVPFITINGIPYAQLNTSINLTSDTTLTTAQLPQNTAIIITNYTTLSYILTLPIGYTFNTTQYGNTSTTFTLKPQDALQITYIGSNIVNINSYDNVPPTTQDFLTNLSVNRACSLILQTEFAKDTGVKGEYFIKQLEDQWNEYINERILKRSDEGKYQYPPLLNLTTNGNQYDLSAPLQGPIRLQVGRQDALGFANKHINDPAQKLFYPFFGLFNPGV